MMKLAHSVMITNNWKHP